MIHIVNYGLGNLASIQNMLKKVGVNSIITSDPAQLLKAEKLILPGVGAFDEGMSNLKKFGISEILNQKVLIEKKGILGICLGMQLMTNGSEEGSLPGLGWIDGRTVRFSNTNIKVPHMGWNIVKPNFQSSLFPDTTAELRFYHVHSYYVKLNEHSLEVGSTTYEREFTSAFQKDNIWGVQFHPEKSHRFGMDLLRNFSQL